MPLPLKEKDLSILPNGYTITATHSPSHSIIQQFLRCPYAPSSIRRIIS
ncbi:hypothetical protein ES319_D10G137800v1 [Gossypium barbadense]|uniref:Uncharacterized protein n=2 Tax=Gossypium TaxID=3633 RepID=A0A5J5PQC4_GOSBA|nr:hypothetical protein ES319_D10G137800v1 [Gossypium barbadense]TYG50068.1 hypothetical protein ES288_D10G146400v1 [Gossypium darwinii]